MTNCGDIIIRDETGEIEKFSFQDEREFRIVYFDEQGVPRTVGKLPWRDIKHPLRRWIREWAAKQDLADIKASGLGPILAKIGDAQDRMKTFFRHECG